MKGSKINIDKYDILIFLLLSVMLYLFMSNINDIYFELKTKYIGYNSYINDVEYLNNNLSLYINIIRDVEENISEFDFANEKEYELAKDIILKEKDNIKKHEKEINKLIQVIKDNKSNSLYNSYKKMDNIPDIKLMNYYLIEDIKVFSNRLNNLKLGKYIDNNKLDLYHKLHDDFLSKNNFIDKYIKKSYAREYNNVRTSISKQENSNTKILLMNHYNNIHIEELVMSEYLCIFFINILIFLIAILLSLYYMYKSKSNIFFKTSLIFINMFGISLIITDLIKYYVYI